MSASSWRNLRIVLTAAAVMGLGACEGELIAGGGGDTGLPGTGDTDVAVGDTDVPVGDTDVPAQDTDVPAQDTDVPADDTDVPADDTDVPADDTDVPAEDTDVPPAGGNFQVEIDGAWQPICCVDGEARLSEGDCAWSEYDRRLTDEAAGLVLNCPEGDPAGCWCDGGGERLHGENGWDLDASLKADGGGPVYPNEWMETCLYIDGTGLLTTHWTPEGCPDFRLL